MSEPIKRTRDWLEQVVIACNFCPFARAELSAQRIHFHQVDSKDLLNDLVEQCEHLVQQPEVSTSLLIYPTQLGDFYQYLNFVDAAQHCLEQHDWLGVFQLASFHPDYCFADSHEQDPANYTNRSPYPIVHLLREQSLSDVLKDNADADKIPQRNIRYCEDKGLAYMQALYAKC